MALVLCQETPSGNNNVTKFLMTLFLLCSLIGVSAAQVSPIHPPAPRYVSAKEVELKAEQHKATFTIIIAKVGSETGLSGCSSTAISEHVLVTAAHCDVDGGVLYINQSFSDMSGHALSHPLAIAEKYYDHQDHMLLVVPGASFKHIVHYDPNDYKPLTTNDRYYFWGNPQLVVDQYREGYITGTANLPEVGAELDVFSPFWLLSGPVVGGDSGSGVFAADGRFVGVITYAVFGGLFAGVYPLAFTSDQVNQAEGKGNFTYVDDPRQQITVNVKLPAPAPTPKKDYSIHILLVCLFLVYKLRSILGYFGVAAVWSVKAVRRVFAYAWRFVKVLWSAIRSV